MSIRLREVVSFYAGGRTATIAGRPLRLLTIPQQPLPWEADPNGEFEVQPVYVQGFRLVRPRHAEPVLLLHGGGLTGAVWETLADGRPGWVTRLLARGFDVFVADAVGQGRSPWAHHPEVFGSPPIFRSKREAWELFRIGPPGSYSPIGIERKPYAGSQFSTQHFDAFARRIVPRWPGMEEATLNGVCAALCQIGPCLVTAHSSASCFAFGAAVRIPHLVSGLVLLEPSWFPEFEAPAEGANLAVTLVFGDHIEQNAYWSGIFENARSWSARPSGYGQTRMVELPQCNVYGNTHCLMSDNNADELLNLLF